MIKTCEFKDGSTETHTDPYTHQHTHTQIEKYPKLKNPKTGDDYKFVQKVHAKHIYMDMYISMKSDN